MTYATPDRVDGSNTMGGYSDSIVVSEHFVVRIPEKLDLASAAPILCAGITTYSPLKHYGVKAGDKVGILGMGGLGHMGIKFAKAMGAEVTLFTRSASKAEEGRRQGADHVIVSTDADQMKAAAGHFDFLLDTIPVQHDLNPYLDTLRFDGVHILVGLIEPIDPPVHAGKLVMSRRRTGRLVDRRHRRNPGSAGFLRRAQHHLRHRNARHPSDQRGLRAHDRRRREVPFRDRHGDAEGLIRPSAPSSADSRAVTPLIRGISSAIFSSGMYGTVLAILIAATMRLLASRIGAATQRIDGSLSSRSKA